MGRQPDTRQGPLAAAAVLLLALAAPSLADYLDKPGQDWESQARIVERKQELQREREKLVAAEDQLYNQAMTAPEPPGLLQTYKWELLAGLLVLLGLARGAVYWRERARAGGVAIGARGASAQSIAPLAGPDHAGAPIHGRHGVWWRLGLSSSRRRGHRHGHRRSSSRRAHGSSS